MKKELIVVKDLTKDYGEGRGIFDLNFSLYEGETLGFVGANGAGKTTTIRHIMGFLKPDKGSVTVCGLDAWTEAEKTKEYIGYIPGEIAFPDLKNGTSFLKSQAELLNLKDMTLANSVIEKLQLDPSANLKRMSKGMKQKTAIVSSIMNDPKILILDEPTTGLDPLMRESFLEILEKEKQKGKSIIMSSHIYEELEQICDRVALIDKGRIVNIVQMETIKNRPNVELKIEFNNKKDFEKFLTKNFKIIRKQTKYNQVTISIIREEIGKLFKILTEFDVKFISEVKFTLEKYFNDVIKNLRKEAKDDNK